MKITAKLVILFAMTLACSACVNGMSEPDDHTWQWVKTSSDEAALEKRIEAEFTGQLPMPVRQFNDKLEADGFQCSVIGFRPFAPTATVNCVYFGKGPTQDNACTSGKDVAISIIYSYPQEDGPSSVTEFKTRVISRLDGDAHSSGICFPL